MNYANKLSKRLSFGEEIANSVTHAVGAVLMLFLLPTSAIYSYETHGTLSAVGTHRPSTMLWPMTHLRSMSFESSITP